MKDIKLAIVGCGAVTEIGHLPAINMSSLVEPVLLVDKNLRRSKTLASKYDIPNVSNNYLDVPKFADAAIIAVPHSLHAPISIDLMNRGIHILVEKPMALNVHECNAMIAVAETNNVTLTVGLMRRFLHSHQFLKEVLSDTFLGKILSFDVREGNIYDWPLISDYLFRKESGGGVLFDTGPHTLDLILWWLGDYESFEYFDDYMGGVEANCEIYLKMKNGSKGIIELSNTRNLRNTAVIRGEEAILEVEMFGSQISIQPVGKKSKLTGKVSNNQKNIYFDSLLAQLESWVNAIQNKSKPLITGKDGRKIIELFEACHKNRKQMELPWASFLSEIQNEKTKLNGKKILVTGGTGFIGGHLVELLVMKYHADVRVLVKNFTNASRIARYPVKMIRGDITDIDSVRKAMKGCEIVFHCAFGSSGTRKKKKEITITGTENVLITALEQNVKRVVHVSTMSVYGKTKDGDYDESAKRRKSKDSYADTKLKAENLAFHYFKKYGLPVSIIQPTIVYGPYAGSWTLFPIHQLTTGRIILVEGGTGICNAVYVDDVVQAMILAATKEEAVGQAFLISSEKPTTWKNFYGAYEKMLGFKSTISLPLDKTLEFYNFNKKIQQIYNRKQVLNSLRDPYFLENLIKLPFFSQTHRILEEFLPPSRWNQIKNYVTKTQTNYQKPPKPIHPLAKDEAEFFRARTRFSIDKAKKLLNYKPSYDLNTGMKNTRLWVKYSDIL